MCHQQKIPPPSFPSLPSLLGQLKKWVKSRHEFCLSGCINFEKNDKATCRKLTRTFPLLLYNSNSPKSEYFISARAKHSIFYTKWTLTSWTISVTTWTERPAGDWPERFRFWCTTKSSNKKQRCISWIHRTGASDVGNPGQLPPSWNFTMPRHTRNRLKSKWKGFFHLKQGNISSY